MLGFGYGYRYQLYLRALDYFNDHMRRVRIVKVKEFYNDLVITIRSRAHLKPVGIFYTRCQAIYKEARDHGVTTDDLHIKVIKAARVTGYFSANKLWKDCTSQDLSLLCLERNLDHDADDSDNDSMIVHAGNGNDY